MGSGPKIGGILLKKISGKDIAKFLARNPKVWVKYTANHGAAVTLKKVKITQLKEVNWKQKDDILDVAIHAEGNAYKALIEKRGGRVLEVGLHEKSLAKLIESSAKSSDQPVRLLSCSNLASAEKLSKYLDRPVIATDAIVRVHPDGGITTIARSGNSSQQWYKLEGGKRVEVSKPKEPEAKHKGNFVQMGKVSLAPKVEAELSRLRIDKAEFLKDYLSIKNAVDANPALVEGWKVLYKNGADDAMRQNPLYVETAEAFRRIKFDTDPVKNVAAFKRTIKRLDEMGSEGKKYCQNIIKEKYLGVQGYNDLVKKPTDVQAAKAINQAINKADELTSKGVSKSSLRFEHDLKNGVHDIDLGVKHPSIPDAYLEAYQFKYVGGKITSGKIQKAAIQLKEVNSNKKILEFACDPSITIKEVNDPKVIKELRFQSGLYDPKKGNGIDEFHFRLSDGSVIIKDKSNL